MRKTKFRVWDKTTEYMDDRVRVASIGGDTKVEVLDGFSNWRELSKDDYILMQYTGLKDRVGTEIYEGDILELINEDGKRVAVVCKFGNRRLVTDRGIAIDIQCFYFEVKGWKANPVVSNYKGLHDLEIMEVRGNIYENPELV